MRFIALLLATTITLSASAASAALYYEVTTTVPSGNPLNALEVGDKLILDIGVYTDPGDQAAGLSGSVNNYDESIVSANAPKTSVWAMSRAWRLRKYGVRCSVSKTRAQRSSSAASSPSSW